MMGWTRYENELIVADYLTMLMKELSERDYSKSEHRKSLKPMLNGRGDSSIEYKHQNISAVLLENGFPAIDGYKPARNYQRGVFPEIVVSQARNNSALCDLLNVQVEQDESLVPRVADILRVLENPPESRLNTPVSKLGEGFAGHYVDYLAREAQNISLGQRGEEFVLNYEKARLIYAGKDALADRVEHTSRVQGDGAGFDIRSFDVEGADRFIEVKTTRYGRYAPFFVTSNELAFSKDHHQHYRLYRLYAFGRRTRLFQLPGHLCHNIDLKASEYRATL